MNKTLNLIIGLLFTTMSLSIISCADNSVSSQSQSEYDSKTKSVQCFGKTSNGQRCKRMTTNLNGRCFQH